MVTQYEISKHQLVFSAIFKKFLNLLIWISISLINTTFRQFLPKKSKYPTPRLVVEGKKGYRLRPHVSRQMLRVRLKTVGRCFLSIVTLGHAYPLSRLSVHHLIRDSRENCQWIELPFYSTNTKKLNIISTTKTKQKSTLAD